MPSDDNNKDHIKSIFVFCYQLLADLFWVVEKVSVAKINPMGKNISNFRNVNSNTQSCCKQAIWKWNTATFKLPLSNSMVNNRIWINDYSFNLYGNRQIIQYLNINLYVQTEM